MSGERAGAPVVLIADDDDDIRALVGFRLEREGLSVLRAADGEEALRLAQEHRPDVCVLDWMMPKRDGLGVTRELRSSAETASLPILLLTAAAGEEDVMRGLEAGVDEYLRKPFSPQELTTRVQRVLERDG